LGLNQNDITIANINEESFLLSEPQGEAQKPTKIKVKRDLESSFFYWMPPFSMIDNNLLLK
jgi:hypothetical protein